MLKLLEMTEKRKIIVKKKRDLSRSEASLLDILIERNPERAELIIKRLKRDQKQKPIAKTPDMV